MNMKEKYLTKSKFIVASECPVKLYYYNHPDIYPNSRQDNEFTQALIEGGFQVGELAKCHYPDGIEVTTLDHKKSLNQTFELMKSDNITIFEAAIKYKDSFIRVDILKKRGREIEVIEVKSKSYNHLEDTFIANDYIRSKWYRYFLDVAFQTWIIERALPDYNILPYLMLTDRIQRASVDGLNQHFLLRQNESGQYLVDVVGDVYTPEILGNNILILIPARQFVEKIWQGEAIPEHRKTEEQRMSFEEQINYHTYYQERDEKPPITIHKNCKRCEYRISPDKIRPGQKSGFEECWKEKLGWKDRDFDKPHIFDIWNFRKVEECLQKNIYFMKDLNFDDDMINPQSGITQQRQYLQITETLSEKQRETIDPILFKEMSLWKYPLHFIDFETSMVAVPFHKGLRPYEQIAFQFSSHTVEEDGSLRHNEWITKDCKFPNFNFLRSLKKVLEEDDGTIFRYAAHENTILRCIYDQILNSNETLEDSNELLNFIDSITEFGDTEFGDNNCKICGQRNMVDMCELVRKYYYHPAMKGSNSLKVVLPAILQSSQYLKEKYTYPYYSRNFEDGIIWWQEDGENVGCPIDPYEILPHNDNMVIKEGGMAMIAYARMQFMNIDSKERKSIVESLLRYCELDTLAMVMIWEHWKYLQKKFTF